MKQCPNCHRSYLDETLNFCLEDGSWLSDGSETADYPTEVIVPAFASSESRTLFMDSASIGAEAASRSQVTGTRHSNSIAVLPFAHLSSDPDDEYFCDGLAEELINALARIEDLKIVARTSAFSFKGKNADISQIGKVLNVRTILEGSVRKSGDRLRITVQLINAADGYHIWSQRYDRKMRDVFDLQDEITLAVVDALKSKLLGDEKAEILHRFTANTEAFHHYLQGRFYKKKITSEQASNGVENFKNAFEK
ncbi:MAG: hypothetical protein ACT4O9_08795 [Blastocatellia bacterium]